MNNEEFAAVDSVFMAGFKHWLKSVGLPFPTNSSQLQARAWMWCKDKEVVNILKKEFENVN